MIVSDSPRFICFQPWKCGSTTLYLRLKRYDCARYPQNEYFNEILGKHSHKHIALDDFFKLPESRHHFARFTFIRNPYDRLYSGFLQRRHRLRNLPPTTPLSSGAEAELESIEQGFSDYASFLLQKKGRKGKAIAFRPLTDYVYFEGRPEVDAVGFVETFETSFVQICECIGIDEVKSKNGNIRYEKSNLPVSSDLSSARYRYLDKFSSEAIEAVNGLYENDFRMLGYRKLASSDMSEKTRSKNMNLSPFSDAFIAERNAPVLRLERSKVRD